MDPEEQQAQDEQAQQAAAAAAAAASQTGSTFSNPTEGPQAENGYFTNPNTPAEQPSAPAQQANPMDLQSLRDAGYDPGVDVIPGARTDISQFMEGGIPFADARAAQDYAAGREHARAEQPGLGWVGQGLSQASNSIFPRTILTQPQSSIIPHQIMEFIQR